MLSKISDSNESENITVFLRIRPLAKSELYEDKVIVLDQEVYTYKLYSG